MLDPIFYPVMGISIVASFGVALIITVIQGLRGKTARFLRYFLMMLIACLLTFYGYLVITYVLPLPGVPSFSGERPR
jgi:hypothetical protein